MCIIGEGVRGGGFVSSILQIWVPTVFTCPLKLSKELNEKLLGSDREGLGIGLGIRITDLNQIADLKHQFWRLLNSDRRSEPNTMHAETAENDQA